MRRKARKQEDDTEGRRVWSSTGDEGCVRTGGRNEWEAGRGRVVQAVLAAPAVLARMSFPQNRTVKY